MVLPFLIMGAIQNNSAKIYLTIAEGKICRQFTEQTPTSKQRITKSGKLVHEEFYKGWTGKIKDVFVNDGEYGKRWIVVIDDGEHVANLQFNYSSGYASTFLKALPNVDLSQPVEIEPSMKIEGDKKRVSIFMRQNGQPIKWAFTKDNPNGLPPMEKLKVKGVETWDDTKMMEFLEIQAKNHLNPVMPF